MNNAQNIKYDTLTLILCYESHKRLYIKERCLKLARAAKHIRNKTKSTALYAKCRELINLVSRGRYTEALKITGNMADGYKEIYGV